MFEFLRQLVTRSINTRSRVQRLCIQPSFSIIIISFDGMQAPDESSPVNWNAFMKNLASNISDLFSWSWSFERCSFSKHGMSAIVFTVFKAPVAGWPGSHNYSRIWSLLAARDDGSADKLCLREAWILSGMRVYPLATLIRQIILAAHNNKQPTGHEYTFCEVDRYTSSSSSASFSMRRETREEIAFKDTNNLTARNELHPLHAALYFIHFMLALIK